VANCWFGRHAAHSMQNKPRMGRPLKDLELTDEEREKLELIARRPKTSQRMALRARIVLLSASGKSNSAVCEQLRCSMPTVGKWRERFRVHRLEGLVDEPRPGAPRRATDAKIEEVVTKTLEAKPRGQTHWSQRAMAKEVGLSQPTIHRIWKTFGLQPHRIETFKLSPDPLFVEKVRDIAGLYLNPPEHAVVLCVDEKSQIQALNRTQPILPLRPGVPKRQTHDYERNGTTILFAALNAHTGEVVSQCYQRHPSQEYLRFLRHLNEQIADKRPTSISSSTTTRPTRHPQSRAGSLAILVSTSTSLRPILPGSTSWNACSPSSRLERSAVARFSVSKRSSAPFVTT
jgi:transposase